MKSFLALAVTVMTLAFEAPAAAQSPDSAVPQPSEQATSAPTLVRVDGELKTATGEVRQGAALLVVSLYAGREDKTPLWVEQQLVTLDASGGYSLYAGATQAEGLPKEFFMTGAARWLGVAVQGEPEQLRIMLVTMPYALKAREAETLAGKTAADFVLADQLKPGTTKDSAAAEGGDPGTASTVNQIAKFINGVGGIDDSGLAAVGGSLGVGTTNPTQAVDVVGSIKASGTVAAGRLAMSSATPGDVAADFFNSSTTGYAALFRTAANDSLRSSLEVRGNTTRTDLVVLSNGNVGINTTTPTQKLDVAGTLKAETVLATTVTGSRLTTNAAVPGDLAADIFNSSATGYGALFRTAANDATRTALEVRGNTSRVDLAVMSNGNVGVGTAAPSAKLHVAGNAVVDGNIGAKYQDVAEWVETDEPLEAGTVVIVDPVSPDHVKPAHRAYDTRVAGAVSRQPGLVLGEQSDSKAMVAQSGRVRVKADASYGPIKIGDLLVTSPTRGHAMRSKPMRIAGQALHRPGTLVGKALEPLAKGKGEILVLLTLQ